MRFEVHCAMPRTQGKPIEWSPPSISGSAPDEKHVRDAARDLVEALFEIGRNREHVAGVAQRHLLAQVDAELVVVGRVERRDAADALRPEARAGAVGGAGIERNADDGGVVLADVVDVLDIGRLEERVDAGEMRQLAAREGRDRLVGEAVGARQPHVERPLLLLAPTRLGEAAFRLERLPALRRQPVEIRDDAGAAAPARDARPALRERRVNGSSIMARLLVVCLRSPLASIGLLKRSTGTGVSRVRSRS